MSDIAIQVENISKKYILSHHGQEQYKTLRDVLSNGAKSLGNRLNPRKDRSLPPSKEEFWAIQEMSFEIKQGDRVGIIGRNGAGKSTLLKILSRITEPTSGRIRIKGRVASLLEVGTGFHPELTGRENIFLNGAILGMEKAEIIRKFDEIVAFAEVEQFLDTPVKQYSSGMYVRLAFAVAAHLEPEILIVDEVLAVGDAQFQKKCLGKMKDVSGEGRTVLFVSHNMAAINALCSTGIALDKGRMICNDTITKCIANYGDRTFLGRGDSWVRPHSMKSGGLIVTEVCSTLRGKQPNLNLEIDIKLESRLAHKSAYLAVDILSSDGTPLMQALPTVEGFITDRKSKHLLGFSIELPPLIPGYYVATIWVGSHNTETLDEVREAVRFEVLDSPTVGRSFPHTIDHGFVVPHSSVKQVVLQEY
jgi:lipopolysaccharide transport system ATP-binding protein